MFILINMFKNFVFDLDGTLLETLPDICLAMNEAMEKCGYPYRYDVVSAKRLIGDGVDNLIHRALADSDGELTFNTLKPVFMPLYKAYQGKTGGTMKNAVEALSRLKEMGCKLFVCTNKPNPLTKIILTDLFGEKMFDFMKGLDDGEAPKPDAHNIRAILDGFGLKEEETLFVGDSMTDYKTAKNGNLAFCLCLYGYGTYTDEFKAISDYHINDLLELIELAK